MAQALLFINGELINRKVSAEGGLVDRLTKSGMSDSTVLDELYWAALGRAPRSAERQSSLASIRRAEAAPVVAAPVAKPGAVMPVTTPVAAVKSPNAITSPTAPMPAMAADPKLQAITARRHAFEDMFWVLLNSKEFLFNH